jgi:hypothetical protein
MYRQGDVLLIPIPTDDVPTGATDVPLERGRVILAHGEATGHHHSFAAPSGGVQLLEADGERYLTVDQRADLEHQEHDTIPVEPGTYRVIRQREYDDAEEWRRVAD